MAILTRTRREVCQVVRHSAVYMVVRATKLIAIGVLAMAILWAPTSSMAAPTKIVPPGVSGQNQYSETLPGPGGNTKSRDPGNESDRTPAQALGAKNARELERLGPEGRLAAELVAKTAPQTSDHGNKPLSRRAAGARGSGGSSSSGGDSGLDQVLGQITGTGGSNSGGMDWLLPLLIGASILTAAAYLLSKRRSAGPQD